jgi:hypothetical protein
MSNHRHGHGPRPAREYFTLGEHTIGSRHFRFRYDGRTYLILEQEPEQEPPEGQPIHFLPLFLAFIMYNDAKATISTTIEAIITSVIFTAS